MGRPEKRGRFGEFGGVYVPESLIAACSELEEAFESSWVDPEFRWSKNEAKGIGSKRDRQKCI